MNKKTTATTAVLEAKRVKRRLLTAAGQPDDVLLIKYDNTYDGFDDEAVDEARDDYGRNIITAPKTHSLARRLLEAFVNPFTIVLLVLAFVSIFTGDLVAVIIVLVMVTISGLLRFVQELRSQAAAQKLNEMVETTASVQRQVADEATNHLSSGRLELPMDELVVGDIVYLAAGDMVPADVRVVAAKDLFVSQSSLTGESEPVEKFADPISECSMSRPSSSMAAGSKPSPTTYGPGHRLQKALRPPLRRPPLTPSHPPPPLIYGLAPLDWPKKGR